MKKIFQFILVAVAAIAISSCTNKEEGKVSDKNSIHISVIANANDLAKGDVATKTYLGTNPDDNTPNTVLWGTGEYMKLCVTAGETNVFANSAESSADSFNGKASATFDFEITPGEASTYTYQGLYPASAAVASNNESPASYKVNLISTQNAAAGYYDPAAYIMVAQPEPFNSVQTEWMASFRRATALNKITLKNVPTGVSIKRVVITAPTGKYLAGARHIDLTTGESGDIYSGGGRTESVEVKYATPLTGANVDIWFTSWDVEIAAGETLTIVAYTTNQKSYTKTITVPNGKSIKFQEGYLNTLGATMAGIDAEDVTEFDEGNYVVLAKDGDNYYALRAEKESGKERLLSEAYAGSLSSYEGNADIIWNATKSGDSFIFENSSKYLGYKGSSNESYWLEADDNWTETNYLLDVTAQETVGQYYVTLHSNSSRYLSKNSSSGFFAFYGNTSQKADIVFVPATVDTRAEVSLSFDEPLISLSPSEAENFTGQVATAYSGDEEVEDLPITYSFDGDSDFGGVNESTGEISLSGEPGSAIVTATFAGNDTYQPATASYTITVTGASSITLTGNNITAGENTVQGKNNSVLAYRLGTASNNGSLTFEAGYATITFTLAGWASGTRSFSITNGKIDNSATLSPATGSPSGNINAGFNTSYSGTEYTIVVTDPTQEVVFSGRRAVVWGFTATAPVVDSRTPVELSFSATEVNKTTANYSGFEGQTASASPNESAITSNISYAISGDAIGTINTSTGAVELNGSTGTATVTAAFAGDSDYKPAEATYTITVSIALVGDGTASNPYTAGDILALYPSEGSGDEEMYVTGTITEITEVSTIHGNATYTISDGTRSILVYRGKYVGNTDFTNEDQIAEDDEVVIYGKIGIYNNAPQMAQGNYLVSINGKSRVLTAGTLNATPNASNKQITVTWGAASGSDETINYVVSCGDQTFNATSAGSHTFTMSDFGSYEVTVVASAADALSVTSSTSVLLSNANDGSLEHPYSASEARTLALGGNTGSYYIYGTITKIQNQYDASHGTANFWIDENGTSQTVFEGYKIKYFENKAWVDGNAQLAVGDEVVIYGTLTVYNTTPETSSGYLVSLNGTTKGLTLAAPTVTTNTTNSAKEITVAWTAATGTESAISYVVTCGSQTYNATAAGSHTFTMSDYGTYSVSVEASASDAIDAVVRTSASLVDPNAGAPTDYTMQWGPDYNSQSVGSYTASWNATKDGFTVNMANFNNNNNEWEYVKCGRKNNVSVATIITDAAIPEAIKTVTITIDALTAAKINSIKLYVSNSKTSGWASVGTFTKATGAQSVTINNPATNQFYKLEFDCASGSSNGLLTLSKLVFSTN